MKPKKIEYQNMQCKMASSVKLQTQKTKAKQTNKDRERERQIDRQADIQRQTDRATNRGRDETFDLHDDML